jgi:hypothetical protein
MESFTPLDALRSFRDSLYRCFVRRADALFELEDAVLTAGIVPSPVHLSLEPSHRRGWGSLYAARQSIGGGSMPISFGSCSLVIHCSLEGSLPSTPWTL